MGVRNERTGGARWLTAGLRPRAGCLTGSIPVQSRQVREAPISESHSSGSVENPQQTRSARAAALVHIESASAEIADSSEALYDGLARNAGAATVPPLRTNVAEGRLQLVGEPRVDGELPAAVRRGRGVPRMPAPANATAAARGTTSPCIAH